MSSSIASVDSRSYQYDLGGNRTRRAENGTTSDLTYDRTDVAKDQVIAGTTRLFSYDRYGNLLQAPDKTSVYTTYGYDEASRPTSMAIAGGSTATFAVDPLDRKATRTVGAATDTYGYQGSTEVAFETGSSGTRSLLDVDGSRLAVKNGSSVAWVLFDLHGSVAGLCSGTSVTDAYRYDAFGQTMASYSSGSATANPWKYRGLLGVAPGTNTDLLYDMSARDYAPNLGTFTQWDSVQGSAANPLSMNRYLYALANPATLIDPDGHFAIALFAVPFLAEAGAALAWGAAAGIAAVVGFNVVGPMISRSGNRSAAPPSAWAPSIAERDSWWSTASIIKPGTPTNRPVPIPRPGGENPGPLEILQNVTNRQQVGLGDNKDPHWRCSGKQCWIFGSTALLLVSGTVAAAACGRQFDTPRCPSGSPFAPKNPIPPLGPPSTPRPSSQPSQATTSRLQLGGSSTSSGNQATTATSASQGTAAPDLKQSLLSQV